MLIDTDPFIITDAPVRSALSKPRRKPVLHTQRSLKALRDAGYLVAITERWNDFAKIRQDLFGFVDLLALRENETLAVQVTSRENISSRVAKISESEHIAAVRKAGWRIEVHGWRKEANGRYSCKVVDVS